MIKKFYLSVFALLLAFSAILTFSAVNAQHGGFGDDEDGGGNTGRALRIIGLTSDGRLLRFNENDPREAVTLGTISGFTGGDTAFVGIDYRVQDGLLYGVGNAGGIYRFNSANSTVATFVNSLTVPLSGTRFGVDFNPVPDRLRIISDTGQNLRHNVNPGGTTINDTALSYTPPTVATGVTGAAYTNNDLDANTATTLYDIDSTMDQVVIQSPANSGMLAATGRLTLDTTSNVGFDIYSTIRGGMTVDNEGYATLTATDNSTQLYSINLLTGRATARGAFSFQNQVIDIAIPLNQRRR